MIKEKRKNKQTILENVFVKYTICFGLISLFIAFLFLRFKKGFLWQSDGFHQHLLNLSYFRSLLIDFFTTGKFQTFTWHIGGGIDTFANLAYFILGDFLTIFSVFFPEDKLYLLYYILVFARIYLVGLSFICYCKYKKMNDYGTLIGALMYAFCGYCLFAGFRHPYFTNSVAVFPLLMIGIEKIVNENKKAFYVLAIALATFCNFYFAYSFFIIIGIYAIFLTISKYRQDGFKKIMQKILTVIFYSLLGILLTAVVLLPTAYLYLTSSRVGFKVYPYPPNYYRSILPSLITLSSTYWRIFTVSGIILITLPYFLKHHKEDKPKFYLFLVLLIPLLISQVGSIFMGFSFPNNRWSFVVAFFLAYMTTFFFNWEKPLDQKDKKFIIFFNIIYFAIIFISGYGMSRNMFFTIIIGIIFLSMIFNYSTNQDRNKFLKKILVVVIISIIYFTYSVFGVENLNYSNEFVNFNAVNYLYKTNKERTEDLNKALNYVAKQEDNDFYRLFINGIDLVNLPLTSNYNYNSLPFYYSIFPKEIWQISDDIKSSQQHVTKAFNQLDNRTKITTLLGNKYYISDENFIPPYGYELLKGYRGESKIYVNEYALPFVMFYDKTITTEEYNNLTPIAKETSLLKQVAVEDDKVNLGKGTTDFSNEITTLSFPGEKLEVKNTSKNKITINLEDQEALKNSEVYVYLTGLKFTPETKEQIINRNIASIQNEESKLNQLNEIAQIKNKYKFYEPSYEFSTSFRYGQRGKTIMTRDYKEDPYFVDNSTLLVNLGYFEEFKDNIEISFSKIGEYNVDNIEVIGVSMTNYEEDITNLKRSSFKLEEYNEESLSGSIDVKKDGIIKFATLYSKGWEIYIDDEKVEPLKLNNAYLGAQVSKGSHKVTIKYHTPYLKEGIYISLGTSTILIIMAFYHKYKKRKI